MSTDITIEDTPENRRQLAAIEASQLINKKWPVIECFGPVVQGEGIMAGQQTMFVRFGGCDSRCTWCDSLHAVIPEQVNANKTMMSVVEIVTRLRELGDHCHTVTLSGGNPAIHDLSLLLVDGLHRMSYQVAVETQGTIWQDWIKSCDTVTLSPKPPSSGMEFDAKKFSRFMHELRHHKNVCVKIVVFDDADYEFAVQLRHSDITRTMAPSASWYLQPGTDVYETSVIEMLDMYRSAICGRTKGIIEKACRDPRARDFRILPQVHSLLYGHKQGV